MYALRSFFIWQFKNTGEGEDGLLAIKKINNNAVICRDNNGRELIALGKGIGYEAVPRDIPLSRIERTFYEVDESYYPLAQVLPHDILTFSDRIVDIAKNRLPYQLSPNLVVLLGDHISFAIERAQKKLFVAMPLAWDVQQLYPVEYEIGEYAVSRIEKEFKTRLPANEAVGIALCIINGKKEAAPPADPAEQTQDAEMLEQITEIVEDSFGILINRKSFNFPGTPRTCSISSGASIPAKRYIARIWSFTATSASNFLTLRSAPIPSPCTSSSNGEAISPKRKSCT